MTAKLGYSFIVVTNPTTAISVTRKNTEYVIIAFIAHLLLLFFPFVRFGGLQGTQLSQQQLSTMMCY